MVRQSNRAGVQWIPMINTQGVQEKVIVLNQNYYKDEHNASMAKSYNIVTLGFKTLFSQTHTHI